MAEDNKDDVTDATSLEPLDEAQGKGAEGQEADTGYQFDDDLTSEDTSEAPASSGGNGGGSYADELFSKTIHAKFRTFYVDLKQSSNGKFVKVSEKSRGRKSTIMMDAEDVPAMIEALQEMQSKF